MKSIKLNSLSISIAFYVLFFILLWPLHRFIFDVDGVGYSIVAEHLIKGDYSRGLNGFWSPLHSWIVIPFIKIGLDVQSSFFITNGIASIFCLTLLFTLSKKFILAKGHEVIYLLVSAIILLHCTYFELAADIILIPLLILYLILTLKDRAFFTFKTQIYFAMIVGLAYYTKTYALPFLVIIHSILFFNSFCILKKDIQWKHLLVFYFSLVLFVGPWVWLISDKYRMFTIGNSSKLNQTWFLGIPVNETAFFRYPYYKDSPGWWEDPFYMQDRFVNMFSSFKLFIKQVQVFLNNIPQIIELISNISAFSFSIIIGIIYVAFRKKNENCKKVLIFLALYPIGYLLTIVEARYIWIFNFILLTAGALILEQIIKFIAPSRLVKVLITALFYLSFLLHPLTELKRTFRQNKGKDVYLVSEYLKSNTQNLNITSNKMSSEGQVVAYLSKKRFFHINKLNYSYTELKKEMSKNEIGILLFYYSSIHEKESIFPEFNEKSGFKYLEIKPGILIFEKFK